LTPEGRARIVWGMDTNPTPQTPEPVQLAMIDGRDALLMVLVRPGETSPDHVAIDAHCNGLTKSQAAYILRHIARQWEAEAQ
jgi:hypothetical protein